MKIIPLIFLILVLAVVVFGQNQSKLNIKLTVGSSNQNLKRSLYQNLTSELALLKDIRVVDNNLYVFELEVLAMEIKTDTGYFLGYALSTAVIERSWCKELLDDKDSYKPINTITSHQIMIAPTTELKTKTKTKEIITLFNSKLEPVRQAMKNIKIIPKQQF